jgi:hypothetical protein
MFVSVTPLDSGQNNESKLIFSCYAGQCSMSELWVAVTVSCQRRGRQYGQAKVAAMISVPLR